VQLAQTATPCHPAQGSLCCTTESNEIAAHGDEAYPQCSWSPEARVRLSRSPANNKEGEIHCQLPITPREKMTCQVTCHIICTLACSDIPATCLVHCADSSPSAQSECLVQGAPISTNNKYCIPKRHPPAAMCYNTPKRQVTQNNILKHNKPCAPQPHCNPHQLAATDSPNTLTTWANADYHCHAPKQQQQQQELADWFG
jgi:hypothetical protein